MGWLRGKGWRGMLRASANCLHPHPPLCIHIRYEYTRRTHPIVHFAIENLGPTPTALHPEIVLRGWTSTREQRRVRFSLLSPGGELPPHTPKQFEAETIEPAGDLDSLWLRSYLFRLTDGTQQRVRLRTTATRTGREVLTWGRYCYQVGRLYCGGLPHGGGE
jgi:hypothetical protein